MKKSTWLPLALTVLATITFATETHAQKKNSGGGSSKPSVSSRPSNSSRPSSSSKPSTGSGSMFGGSGSSRPSVSNKPATSGSPGLFGGQAAKSGGSKFTSPSVGGSQAQSHDTKKQDAPSTKFGSPSTTAPKPQTKFGAPSVSNPPGAVPPVGKTPQTTSSKPAATNTAKSQAQKKEESKKAYVASQKATAPPKNEAIVNGKSVKIDTGSPHVADVRSKPSSYITPQARTVRYETHIINHHYSHPYSYYYSRPVYYGIGPYSSAFWWMMSEWSAERRAQWLYNHQTQLSREAYNDAIRDVEVQQRLAALERDRAPRNTHYVDPEFAENPTDMYDQSYVEAAYNPAVTHQSSGSGIGKFFLISLGIGVGAVLIYLLATRVRFGK